MPASLLLDNKKFIENAPEELVAEQSLSVAVPAKRDRHRIELRLGKHGKIPATNIHVTTKFNI